jgi:hypothetical protein
VILLALLLAADVSPPPRSAPEAASFGRFLEFPDGVRRVVVHERVAPGRRFDVVRDGRRVGSVELEARELTLNGIDYWRVRATGGPREGDSLTLPPSPSSSPPARGAGG